MTWVAQREMPRDENTKLIGTSHPLTALRTMFAAIPAGLSRLLRR